MLSVSRLRAVVAAVVLLIGVSTDAAAKDKILYVAGLGDGTRIGLVAAEAKTENLGDRFVVKGIFKAPRSPASVEKEAEKTEAALVCRDHFQAVLQQVYGYSGRRVTHFDVIYRHKEEDSWLDPYTYRGYRFRVRDQRCEPPNWLGG